MLCMALPTHRPGTCELVDTAATEMLRTPSISSHSLPQLYVPAEVVQKANIQHKRAQLCKLH